MNIISGKAYIIIYLSLAIFSMEMILRLASGGRFSFGNILISLTFSLSIAILFYFISSLFQEKYNHLLSLILLGLTSFIFSSQLIYFKFFKTYYTLYSAGNASQILEFWRDIMALSIKHLPWLTLLMLPTLLFAFYGKKLFSFKKVTGSYRISLVCAVMLTHTISLISLSTSGKEPYSAYDLYYKNSAPIQSTEQLGLLTTMRIDFQRLVFGWEPSLEATPLDKNASTESEANMAEHNILPIDFEKLLSTETNPTLKEMHRYFSNVEPTEKNNYTGKYKGYNLIFITAESFSPYAVHKEVTPTLYKLVNKGYNFPNFYNPSWGVSTSDGEYVACTSLLPKSGVWSFFKSGDNHMPFAMGNQLKQLGYKTVAYHNHTHSYYRRDISHPNMGYAYKGIGNGLDVKKTWPASDLEMMVKTNPEYINSQPFHAYYMTVSGHMQYNFQGNNMAAKNKKYVDDLPYSEQAKAYLATQVELDRALEHLLEQLEQKGIADQTLIALSADHYPYGLDKETIDELAGHPVEENFELYKSPFILYTKGMKPVTIDKPASSLDIIPTLSNLLGLGYDSRLLMGRDIFSDADPLVPFLNKSFITEKGRYNSITREFTPAKGIKVDEEYLKQIAAEVERKFYFSAKILETDYYRKVLAN
ncbi:sulfatase-like hydrolase/transferase [Thalassobacillus pellis]|uniref:sulfatase-like hydrolase/transferase n=1 Tax=Thalassobacillus pellis TaxID=748008 RepID=UPI001960C3DF|nr:hypothetical protein [Thalassobacillus pellis]